MIIERDIIAKDGHVIRKNAETSRFVYRDKPSGRHENVLDGAESNRRETVFAHEKEIVPNSKN